MKTLFLLHALIALFGLSCTEKNTYITSPEDWHPPLLEWITPPESEVRGTVGLDISIIDSSDIVSAELFVNGVRTQILNSTPWRFELITDSIPDGIHIAEVRAWDEHGNLGISPILRINISNSFAQGPQLIWVPDDYVLIQAAINASTDFDTIRVRDGIYYETLNLFGKGIWIESENGAIQCQIDAVESNSVFTITQNMHLCTIRGFWLTGSNVTIRPESGAQANIYNNIFLDEVTWTLWFSTYFGGYIHNNLFSGGEASVQIGYTWGSFYNNIIQNATQYGLWNAAIYRNPLEYGYTILWNNASNYFDFDPGLGDIYEDPQIDLIVGTLLAGSPAIDAGHPSILDKDSSRSDIGPFGGPWAYN